MQNPNQLEVSTSHTVGLILSLNHNFSPAAISANPHRAAAYPCPRRLAACQRDPQIILDKSKLTYGLLSSWIPLTSSGDIFTHK